MFKYRKFGAVKQSDCLIQFSTALCSVIEAVVVYCMEMDTTKRLCYVN